VRRERRDGLIVEEGGRGPLTGTGRATPTIAAGRLSRLTRDEINAMYKKRRD
jgi:hypothetical protein